MLLLHVPEGRQRSEHASAALQMAGSATRASLLQDAGWEGPGSLQEVGFGLLYHLRCMRSTPCSLCKPWPMGFR